MSEFLSDDIEIMSQDIKHRAARRSAIETEFAGTVERYGLSYALEWAEGPAKDLAEVDLATTVVKMAETMSIVAAVRAVVENETAALMSDRYRGSSSSGFHNAQEAAKRTAAASFVKTFGAYLARIDAR